MGIRIANFLINLTNIALSIIGFFLVLRIILKLIPVNSAAPIVSWIYSISSYLMTPFRDIVPDFSVGTAGVLDMVAVITLVGYVIVGYLLIEIFKRVSLTSEEKVATTAHYHDINEDDRHYSK